LPFENVKTAIQKWQHERNCTIDKAGRIVIPKQVRDKLRLGAGDSLALEAEDDQVTLKPLQPGTRLTKERGVWVFHGSKPLSLEEANDLVGQARAQRDRQNVGERR
jgi:AbrB family looped-hinge helix DNA binding protein